MTSISPPLARPIFHLRSRFWPIIRVRLGKTTREFSAAVVQVFRRVAMATATGTWRRRSSTLLFCQYCNGSWLGQLHGCIGITDDGDNIDTARHMRYIWSRKHPNCLRRRHADDSTLRQLVINFNLHKSHLLRVQAVSNVANHYQDKPCSFIHATKHLQLCVLSIYNQHLKKKIDSQSVSAEANFNPRLCSGLIQLISKTIRESRKQVRSLSSHTNTLRRRMPCDGSRPTLGSEQAKALQYGTAPVPRAQDVCDYRFAISYLRRLMSSIGQPDGCGGPCPGSRREWISTAKLKAFQSCQDGPDQLFRSWRQRVPPSSQGTRVQGSIPG